MPALLKVTLLLLLLSPVLATADEVSVPLNLDYRILHRALAEQLFQGPQLTARLPIDASGCNHLQLGDPRIEGMDNGQIRILAKADARLGTPVGEVCLLPLQWRGVLDARLEPYLDAGGLAVDFRVVDSDILKTDAQSLAIPGVLWSWIKDVVHPRLNAVRIDLAPAQSGLEELMRLIAGEGFERVPVRLDQVSATADGLLVQLILQLPASATEALQSHEGPLSDEELAQWDAAWQAWDGFATWLIKILAMDADPELADTLAEILLDARYDLRDALAEDDHGRDPVRELFLKTWDRLAPLLHDARLNIPGSSALQYATFISAANALRALDQLSPHTGLKLDRTSLRSLARLLVPTVSDRSLEYDTEVDPALRTLLGLEPELSEEIEDPRGPLAWLIPTTHAGEIDPVLIKELTDWVPEPAEIDAYLKTLAQLLDQVIAAERKKTKVPSAFFEIYATTLRTTAWQESCWRQFIKSGSRVTTIQSAGGAIGLMQINRHVWRGVYKIDALTRDIGYNARAGNEILVHYLVDFAIKRREQDTTGDPRNLARATYAAYNGGPTQLSRYRKGSTPKRLRAIDAEFWNKYQAMKQQGHKAVKACYGG